MKKFRFKKIETKDAQRLFPIFNDDEIKNALPGLYCQTVSETANILNYFNSIGNQIFEILDKSDNTVGILGAEYRSQNSLELSFFIAKEFRNLHYSSESLREFLLQLSEKQPNITDVFFFINKENQKSKKAVQSIGAKFSHTYEDDEDVYRKTISSTSSNELFL